MTDFTAWASSNAEQSLPRCELTDIPRLMCGCREHDGWVFDFDDLEPSEHAMFAAEPKPEPAVQRMTPAPLPEYRAEPWTEARNVQVATTGSTCGVCERRPAGDAFACLECLDDLRVHLGDVPGLLDDLDVLATRQAVVTTHPREQRPTEHTRWDNALRPDDSGVPVGRFLAARGYNRPLHVERAVLARDALANEVSTAVRAVTEARGVQVPRLDTREASRWLLTHLSSVGLDPAAVDICHGMRKAHAAAQDVIDNADEGVYIGICDDPDCRARMRANPDLPEHRCSTCGATYDVSKRREAIRDKIRDSLITVPEIVAHSATDVATFGKRLHENTLRRWIERGRLVKVQSKPGPTGEVAMYRASDVVDIVQGAA